MENFIFIYLKFDGEFAHTFKDSVHNFKRSVEKSILLQLYYNKAYRDTMGFIAFFR